MTISTRTPEGEPNHCPICHSDIRIEPSRPLGDAPCPVCGSLLWFISNDTTSYYYDPASPEFIAWIAERKGIHPDAVRVGRFDEMGLDSLEVIEWIMDMEERAG